MTVHREGLNNVGIMLMILYGVFAGLSLAQAVHGLIDYSIGYGSENLESAGAQAAFVTKLFGAPGALSMLLARIPKAS